VRSESMRRIVILGVLLAFFRVSILNAQMRGQQPSASSSLAFEVSSIKPDVSAFTPSPGRTIFFGCHGSDGPTKGFSHAVAPNLQIPIGRCAGTRADLGMLLESAWSVPAYMDFAISGTPSWFKTERFAIEAKAENPATERELQEMLQNLLAERFKLQFHYEQREVDGLALVVAKGGQKLQHATGQEDHPGMSMRAGVEPDGRGVQETWTATNIPLAELVRSLLPTVKKPVTDETHLSGNFNFTLGPYSLTGGPDSTAATIFTAIQDLGLRLESRKVPIQLFVIDHLEKPTFD
jgi:uncharacterized protein (TIGR03435 family)